MKPFSAQEIIDARGGYKDVAEALSTPERRVAPTTVHHWWRTNRLPPWREEKVLALPLIERKRDDAKIA